MNQRIASTGTFLAILFSTLVLPFASAAEFGTISGQQPEASALLSTEGGTTSFSFITSLLEELDLAVYGPERAAGSDMPGDLEFSIRRDSALNVWAPQAAWDGFAGGQLSHSGALILEWPNGRLEVDGFRLRPASPDALELVDKEGHSLFRLDYVHTMLHPEESLVTLWNMDVSLTPWLAERMGYPDLAGMVIATAYTRATLAIPLPEQPQGGCTSPNWHDGVNFLTDVELISLGSVQQVAREAGVRVAIAPSATLRNAGTADVPWYEKFTTSAGGTYPQPYDRDQHPFLVWAMYRIVDGIPQQIGQSAVKHAFFTVNSSCSCSGGSILWAAASSPNGQACTDTYGVSNNNTPSHLGIRADLPAFSGQWEQCGSMFAPGATPPGPCAQTDSGTTGDFFERRLVVEESELETEDASYLFEGWYLIRDDIDIFNTMAHRTVNPSFGSTWTFTPLGTHTQGPAIDSWVSPDPDEQGPGEFHTRETTADGHYSLAVKVTELGGGMHRYVYALMNYDFDPRFKSFSLAIPEGISLDNITFLDGDSNGANDWTSSTVGGRLTWTAPAGAELEWGFMATFVFEANAPPVPGRVDLTSHEKPLQFSPLVLALEVAEDFYKEGFED